MWIVLNQLTARNGCLAGSFISTSTHVGVTALTSKLELGTFAFKSVARQVARKAFRKMISLRIVQASVLYRNYGVAKVYDGCAVADRAWRLSCGGREPARPDLA